MRAQRFGGAPQQLVADGEGGEVVAAHVHLAQPADRHAQRAGDGCRRELAQRRLLFVRNHRHPLVRGGQQRFNLGKRHVAVSLMVSAWLWHRIELMRTHRPSIGIGPEVPRILLPSAIAFHSSLLWPLPRSSAIQGRRLPASACPPNSAGREVGRAQRGGDAAIDIEDRRGRVRERRRDGAMQVTHLRDHLAHVPGAGTRGGLVGHGRDPLDEAGAEEPRHRHQHQAHRAVGPT